jgi:hypothetical protein
MISVLFIALVLAMAFLVGLALVSSEQDSGGRPRAWALVVGFVLVYLAVPALLATTRLLDRYDAMPAPALLLVLFLTAVTVLFAVSSLEAHLSSSIGLATLVGFQVFRVPVEWLLHWLAVEQVNPEVMTYSGPARSRASEAEGTPCGGAAINPRVLR